MTIPELRFPEYSTDWNEIRFSDFLTPNFRDTPKPAQNYLAIGIRSHGKGTFQKPDSEPAKIAMDTLYVVRENDLIVNITFAWEGAIAIVSKDDDGGHVSHRFPTYEFNRNLVIHEYFRSVIENRRFRQKLDLISPGGAGRNRVMSKPDFLKLRHTFPPVDEQKKIADFLGAVDGKLVALREKEAALTRFKRGLMQALFSQTLRFTHDDGSPYPDWEEKRLGDVFEWARTNSLSRQHLSYEVGKIQNIHYGDIHSQFKALFKQSAETVPYILPEADVKISNDDFCRVGDVIIADASEDYADIGKAIEIIDVQEKTLVAGLHTYIARPSDGQLVTGFSGYLLRSGEVRKQIMRIAQGISVLGISKTNLEKLELVLPHPEEQQKIADALSAMDSKITAVAEQITQLTAFKKGLLQQMFV